MDKFIQLDHVKKTIRKQVILDDISLSLSRGGIYGFVGRNGSGKSMLFKAICGFLSIDDGRVCVDGKTLGTQIDFPPDMGVIIEKPALLPYLTGLQNLEFLASIRKKITQADVRAAMELVDLDPDSSKKVRAYSLGMKQRLAIAQAVMEKPQLLVLDEPMNALDQQMAVKIKSLLRAERERGCTILLCSHIAGDLEELSDALYEVDAGRVTQKR